MKKRRAYQKGKNKNTVIWTSMILFLENSEETENPQKLS